MQQNSDKTQGAPEAPGRAGRTLDRSAADVCAACAHPVDRNFAKHDLGKSLVLLVLEL